jgi:predicted DCC family thiol-disulfide oxidoreductase YuxK
MEAKPDAPLLIYDGRCGFCKIWIEYWKLVTGDRVAYAASQDVGAQYPQIPRQEFSRSVQLVRPDGSVASGARAVFEMLGRERIYESAPGVAAVAEWAYRIIARSRSWFYWVTRLTFGKHIEPSLFTRTQWLFLKLLAAVYAIAFASLGVQVAGLVGERGISPAGEFLRAIAAGYGVAGYFAAPALFWLNSSDAALRAGCWAGVALAAALLAGRFERAALVLMYALYLSYSVVGQIFLGYQWDALLLEAGFLAIFFGRSLRQQKLVAWLYRLLVFRLYFLSGWLKLASGDQSWRDGTALGFHHHTQPLPTALAWYADQLPAWFQRAATTATVWLELACPFLIFAPRLWRMAGATALIALQAGILATGNYTFFNLLTIALTLFLFDDQLIRWAVRRAREAVAPRAPLAGACLAGALALLGASRLYQAAGGSLAEPVETISSAAARFQIVNSYGLFAVMTRTRDQIVVQGSQDAETWSAYEFRYQPGDPRRAPRWVAPHQPRLDWQMWFAALGDFRASPWFSGFMERLLQGSPDVLALLDRNPFPDRPPRYLRAVRYEYWFTDWAARARTGEWWRREPRGAFFPVVSLRDRLEQR